MGRKDIHVYLKPEAYHALRNLAFSTSRSYSDVISDLLLNALAAPVERCPSIGEVLQITRRYLNNLTENLIRRDYEADACSAVKDPEHRRFCSLLDLLIRGYLHEMGKLLRKRVISSKDLIMLWESKPPRRESEAAGSSIDALLRVALEHAKRSSKAEASGSRVGEDKAKVQLSIHSSESSREVCYDDRPPIVRQEAKPVEDQGSKPEPKSEVYSETEPDLLTIFRRWRRYGSEP